jgi:peroxiredoxin
MAALAAGETAPDFDLPVSNTERVRLASLLEKSPVVLLVYVFDFSPG